MRPRELLNPAFLAALGVLTASALGMSAALDAYKIFLRKLPIHAAPDPITGLSPTLSSVPAETARWKREGADKLESAETIEVLGTENYVSRLYVEKSPAEAGRPRRVEVHGAYYTGMIDTVPHVPERCFVGGGMQLTGGPWVVPIPLNTAEWRPDTAPAAEGAEPVFTTRLSNEYSSRPGSRVRLPRGVSPENPLMMRVSEFSDRAGNRWYAGYFFVANGGAVSSAEGVRLLAFSLTNDYAYYLKVQFTSGDAESPEDLAAMAGSLLDDLLGELMRCVPDWTEVEQGRYPPDNPKRRAGEASVVDG